MVGHMYSLFFYGTLIHPPILERVIGSDGQHLTFHDAVLDQHARFHIHKEDYPAVVSLAKAERVLGRKLTHDEGSVRGVLVTGLTDSDVALLDEFEGHEYTRTAVEVTPISATISQPCHVYIWTDPVERLAPSLWAFDEFLRDKAHRWVGQAGEREYEEVDRRRAMKGTITPSEGAPAAEQEIAAVVEAEPGPAEAGEGALEPFGKAFGAKYWSFEPGWINLNHGSYGAAPRSVIDALRKVQDRCAAAPDRFERIEYMPELVALRERIGNLVGADTDDVVLVQNATTATGTALQAILPLFERGDKILFIQTTVYDAVDAVIRYLIDSRPELELGTVPVKVDYPISHDKLIAKVEAAIEAEEKAGHRVRLAIVDAISSSPGVVVPWQRLVKLFDAHDILSHIDAAHEIGQLPVNLREARPTFWVSNMHKWLHGHRGCAVLYADKRYQHLVHALPIGHSYKLNQASDPRGTPNWVEEHVWNGTMDWGPILSVDEALNFREQVCGGEERITAYCHKLAIDGGLLAAKVLGTDEVMRNPDGEGELVANMVNVRLPLAIPADGPTAARLKPLWFKHQMDSHQTAVPGFAHGGKWWIRLSAQVYNDLSDFEAVARVLKKQCEAIMRDPQWTA